MTLNIKTVSEFQVITVFFSFLLIFSGSFLLSLTVMHLLPDVYKSNNPAVGVCIMLGILFQIILGEGILFLF